MSLWSEVGRRMSDAKTLAEGLLLSVRRPTSDVRPARSAL